MWYVIQTITGKEEELVRMIGKLVMKEEYKNCFVIWRECVWRIEGRYRVHLEPLFPSYVFVETSTPETFFFSLKRVPRLSKLLGSDGTFWAVQKEEEKLLRRMTGDSGGYLVKRSLVRVNMEGEIISAEGVLKEYVGSIVKKKLRKRYVVIEIPFLGEKRAIRLGIRVEGE